MHPVHNASRRARILVVDDVPANLLAVEAILEPLGQELVLASSGQEALKHLLHGDFAVILMDVQMPLLDGFETARLIRARERTRHIPIIFVTALSRDEKFVQAGYSTGAVDYLLKPLDPDILRSKVSVFVELFVRGVELKERALEMAERRRAEEELKRSAQFEQQLLGIVSHDIRTPLSTILACAKHQLEMGELNPEARKAFLRVHRGGERIRNMVDLLLDFTRARLGRGIPVVRGEVDLHELCPTAIDEFTAANPNRTVVFEGGLGDPKGQWDANRLHQVLSNLLDNANKYGGPSSATTVRTYAVGDDSVGLDVHNTGAPIPEALMPKLFQPFELGDAAAHRSSLGLGLFIAQAIVDGHGGTIRAQSGESKGTTFTLCLPRSSTAAAACADPEGGQMHS